MGFENLTAEELYTTIVADARVNWAGPLDVIAAASEESGKRGTLPFCFLRAIRAMNEYFYRLKSNSTDLFRDRMSFGYNGKDYLNSEDVALALNSEFLRRVENGFRKPSFYVVSPQIRYRLDELADETRELVIPAGIEFCDRFGCDREGRLLYR